MLLCLDQILPQIIPICVHSYFTFLLDLQNTHCNGMVGWKESHI